MKFDIEGKAGITTPPPIQIARALKSLRSYGKSSYASLTDTEGNYVQVAGGGVSCMIERFEIDASQRWRAFHDKPSPVRPDGTILVFSAGNIPMRADEWFMCDQVVEVFLAFLKSAPFPPFVHWRSAPGF
ncbi:hypothetical protein [Paraburkholderia sp. J8-2]|uniref:hypothetical protein n=1 Tax=Paraburkholderia sp. J8-2 TaxID=2805440 RepID=UPI002AB7BB5C|nr:hypothetical protein [Paraburkholderia sp. J8-2]